MGFESTHADPDLRIRDAGDCYDYVCVYVDDLLAILKKPQVFFYILIKKYGYTMKGVGDPEYHLGGNFGRDLDGTLHWGAKTYIQKMMGIYERLVRSLPMKQSSPMDEDDHPELYQSKVLDKDGISLYQSLIGAFQWVITLGRFDIAVDVVTMSRFRAEQRRSCRAW